MKIQFCSLILLLCISNACSMEKNQAQSSIIASKDKNEPVQFEELSKNQIAIQMFSGFETLAQEMLNSGKYTDKDSITKLETIKLFAKTCKTMNEQHARLQETDNFSQNSFRIITSFLAELSQKK